MPASDRRTFNRAAVQQGAALHPELGTRSKLSGPRARLPRLGALALVSTLSLGGIPLAQAQDAAPAATPAPTPAVAPAPVVEAPAPAPTPVVAPAPAPVASEPVAVTLEPAAERAAEPPPPTPAEAPPAEEPFKPKLTIGIGLRVGLSMDMGEKTTLTLADSLDQFMFRPFFAGQLTKKVSAFVQANGSHNAFVLIDAYAELAFLPQLSLVVGQHIPANDRNNFCGPFFNNSWNFAAVHSYPMDAGARDRGFTLWGMLGGGVIKYHASMVDVQTRATTGANPINNARYAGRVTLNLLEPEQGYYYSGTYFGKQDVLAIGGVISYQNGLKVKDGGVPDSDFLGLSGDVLFEKNLGTVGTITVEGGYWNFNGTGKNYAVTTVSPAGVASTSFNQGLSGFAGALSGLMRGQSYQVNVSWLSPHKIGSGQLQPNARIQGFDKDAGDLTIFDAGLGYIVDGYAHLYRVNFRHVSNPNGQDDNAIQIGGQFLL